MALYHYRLLPPRTHNSHLIMKKISDKPKLRGILNSTQNAPSLLKTVKVIKNKDSEKLPQLREARKGMMPNVMGS